MTIPNNMFVAGFIGSPSHELLRRNGQGQRGQSDVDGDTFQLAIPVDRAKGLKPYVGKAVAMGMRPEDLFDAEYVAQSIHPGNLDAKVEVTELMGNEVYLYLLTGKNSYVARVDPRTKAKVGNSVRMVANLDKVHFFDKSTEQAYPLNDP